MRRLQLGAGNELLEQRNHLDVRVVRDLFARCPMGIDMAGGDGRAADAGRGQEGDEAGRAICRC